MLGCGGNVVAPTHLQVLSTLLLAVPHGSEKSVAEPAGVSLAG